MTGKKDRKWILPNSARNSSDRGGVSDARSEFFVADCRSTGDREKCLPDFDLKVRSLEIKTHASCIDFFASKVVGEEFFGIF